MAAGAREGSERARERVSVVGAVVRRGKAVVKDDGWWVKRGSRHWLEPAVEG